MSSYDPPTRITFISHPATREQKAGLFPIDEALTEKELAELSVVVWRQDSRARYISSPELRTRQSAEALRLVATEDYELRECDFGAWAGYALAAIPQADLLPWLTDIDAAPHGGESYRELQLRVGRWLDAHQGAGSMVVFTHASVIRAAIIYGLMLVPHEAFLRMEIGPMTLTELRYTSGSWRVRCAGVPLTAVTID